MTTQQLGPVGENRIRPDIRNMLEVHILEDLSLRAACQKAGLRYTKNASQAKCTRSGRAYVEQLKRRRKVIVEFGVDEPCLATLIELRDAALKAGSHIAGVRVHQLCIRVADNAHSVRERAGSKRDPNDMSREEIIAEMQEIKSRAGGMNVDITEDPRDTAFWESMGLAK